MSQPQKPLLSEQEAAIYDRQIRVWGVDAQRRMGQASVLVAGITGTTAEVCKNVVLAGVGSLVLLDDTVASRESLQTTFLIPVEAVSNGSDKQTISEVCAASLRDFNPMVRITVESGRLEDKRDEYFQRFSAVVIGPASLDLLKRVNMICRSCNPTVKYFSVDCRWGYGRIFSDLGNHSYTVKGKEKEAPDYEKYCSLEVALAVPWKLHPKRVSPVLRGFFVVERFEEENKRDSAPFSQDDLSSLLSFWYSLAKKEGVPRSALSENMLKQLLESKDSEFAPTSAILGGFLGQEILRAISGKGKTMNNFLTVDSALPEASICLLSQI